MVFHVLLLVGSDLDELEDVENCISWRIYVFLLWCM